MSQSCGHCFKVIISQHLRYHLHPWNYIQCTKLLTENVYYIIHYLFDLISRIIMGMAMADAVYIALVICRCITPV